MIWSGSWQYTPWNAYRDRTTSQDTLEEGPHELQRLVTENEAVFRAALAAWGLTGKWRSDLAEPEAFVSAELRSADLIVTGAKRQAGLAYSGTRLDPGSFIMRGGTAGPHYFSGSGGASLQESPSWRGRIAENAAER